MRIGNSRLFPGISDGAGGRRRTSPAVEVHRKTPMEDAYQMKKLNDQPEGDTVSVFREKDGQRLLEASFDGVWATDAQLCTTFVNHRMATMLGYSSDEMAGRNLLEFMFPEDIPAEQEALARRRRGISEEFEIRYRRRDGSELW